MTQKQRAARKLFVELLAADPKRDATRAAIGAGWAKSGAKVSACRLLKEPEVRKMYDAALAAQQKRVQFDGDRVILELGHCAFLDPAQVVDQDTGKLKPLHEMPEEVRRAISSIEVEELWEGRGDARERVGDLVKVKFWSKPDALRMLGEHFKLFTQKHEHAGPGGEPLTVQLVNYGKKPGGK